jgi:hypothetical protein
MINKIAAVAALTAALSITSSARADSLNAKPGLWTTTVQSTSNGRSQPPRTGSRCIRPDDIQAANRGFMLDPNAPNNPCKRTDFHATSTSIDWKYECSGQIAMISVGLIKFDSPEHYTGTVTMKGTVMGNPIDNMIRMDGKWVGACTGGAK